VPIYAINVLCVQLTRDLLAIAKFLFYIVSAEHSLSTVSCVPWWKLAHELRRLASSSPQTGYPVLAGRRVTTLRRRRRHGGRRATTADPRSRVLLFPLRTQRRSWPGRRRTASYGSPSRKTPPRRHGGRWRRPDWGDACRGTTGPRDVSVPRDRETDRLELSLVDVRPTIQQVQL